MKGYVVCIHPALTNLICMPFVNAFAYFLGLCVFVRIFKICAYFLGLILLYSLFVEYRMKFCLTFI